ncbi:hypothetical protein R3P38DRAFT_53511 [Favolaschia claudopus]|uniref:F-box domain-containing protein n=1 Tax=Favolaschia claudopus TaxID=2862362 RepID=A0AAW0EKV4_9AGAR
MPSLPQELIHTIISEIDGISSLKACALASTMFRDACQRILLHSLTLSADTNLPTAALGFLQKSPHIAAYITRLELKLDLFADATETTSLYDILDRLENVRHCTVSGNSSRGWNHPDPTTPLFDFLGRQPLRRLKLCAFGAIPLTILSRFLALAPVILLSGVSTDLDVSNASSWDVEEQTASNVEELFLHLVGADILELFAHTIRTTTLRRMSVFLGYGRSKDIISANAETLEHLRIELADSLSLTTTITPPLPALRSIEFEVLASDDCIMAQSGLDLVQSFISSSPQLTRITFVLCCATSIELTMDLDDLLPLPALDAIFSARPAVHCCWRLDFYVYAFGSIHRVDDIDSNAGGKLFEGLAMSVRDGMGRTDAEGRLAIEWFNVDKYRERNSDGFWSWHQCQ